tara:strand:- start:3933 stop:4142 length:210 start_codon:yes stop_codon:yes gene_type:complete
MKWKNQWSEVWRSRFAFMPTQINGTTVWLERYEERYVELDYGCRCELKSHVRGQWQRRLRGDEHREVAT